MESHPTIEVLYLVLVKIFLIDGESCPTIEVLYLFLAKILLIDGESCPTIEVLYLLLAKILRTDGTFLTEEVPNVIRFHYTIANYVPRLRSMTSTHE